MKHGLLVACALVVLAGCGHERTGSGTASLWITRDRGASVLLVQTVPAGLTAMQALDRKADISTRYGGRSSSPSASASSAAFAKSSAWATEPPAPA